MDSVMKTYCIDFLKSLWPTHWERVLIQCACMRQRERWKERERVCVCVCVYRIKVLWLRSRIRISVSAKLSRGDQGRDCFPRFILPTLFLSQSHLSSIHFFSFLNRSFQCIYISFIIRINTLKITHVYIIFVRFWYWAVVYRFFNLLNWREIRTEKIGSFWSPSCSMRIQFINRQYEINRLNWRLRRKPSCKIAAP